MRINQGWLPSSGASLELDEPIEAITVGAGWMGSRGLRRPLARIHSRHQNALHVCGSVVGEQPSKQEGRLVEAMVAGVDQRVDQLRPGQPNRWDRAAAGRS